MPHFTKEEIRARMEDARFIRNLSVIAHVDHGKSTLTDSLIAHAGIIAGEKAGEARYTDTRADEQERCITIKSTGVSLFYEYENPTDPEEKDGFLINLIDSPGHVDFSSEVTAALRVTDGALVVVDAVNGVSVQTETVLRQALTERVRPVLMLNKLDRVFMELKLPVEEAYQNFARNIENINVLIATYTEECLGDIAVDPGHGTVAFGAGLHGWGFTLTHFAKMYASRFGIDIQKMLRRLWGNNFYDTEERKWRKKPKSKDGRDLIRGFCHFILSPIYRLFDACRTSDIEALRGMLDSLGVVLTHDDFELRDRELLKTVMRKFLPAAEALLEMIVLHLPSPREAQAYRCETLYTGPQDDAAATAIKACDPNGPLMMYVSKMVPTNDKGRFYAFGRVFAGTVRSGQRVRILGPSYEPGSTDDLNVRNIQRTVLMMGRYVEPISDVPAGNTVCLVGIDQYLVKTGTITTDEDAYILRDMKFTVAPVVRVAVEPKNPSDLPKLVEGLNRLAKSDPCVEVTQNANGEYVVGGAGQLHIEVCLKDLREEYARVPIVESEPVISFRETVVGHSTRECLAKSANKHNRVFVRCGPISDELVELIESGKMGPRDDPKARAQVLHKEYDWDLTEARRVWNFGPDGKGPNLLVDCTKAVQYLNECKESINAGFQVVTTQGILCEEPCRGIRWDVLDAAFHADAMHRGGAQVMPAARRVLYGSMLISDPTLVEPIFMVDISVPDHVKSGVYSCLSRNRGIIISEEQRIGTPLCHIKALLPVRASFGFDTALRAATSGYAFPQCSFHNYTTFESLALEEGTDANQVYMEIRSRKELGEPFPPEHYLDRL